MTTPGPYELDKEDWQTFGIANCYSVADYEATKKLKAADPSLPFDTVKRFCHLGLCMNEEKWVNGRWI